MNGQQDADFPKGRINSTLWKMILILCFLFTSCSSKIDTENIVGKWKVENLSLNNSPSAFDLEMLDDIFYYNPEWEFESNGLLIQKTSFTNLDANYYRVEGKMLRFYKSKNMIPSELILSLEIIDLNSDKLILAEKSRGLFDFSQVELIKMKS